jgi:hypothetical protein
MKLSFRKRTTEIQYLKNYYKCQEKPNYLPNIETRWQVTICWQYVEKTTPLKTCDIINITI